ncbi:MAG: two-component system sensor kinase FixL [Candidatus Omnitrophota bacterium]|jgi:two-component system, LuxR family, sensor kinase FixL
MEKSLTDNLPKNIADILLLEKAMSCSSCGITVADMQAEDQPLIYINAAFERITGYSAEETLGKNCRFLQGDDRNQPQIDLLRDAMKKGTMCDVVFRNYRKDGSLFYNELHMAPILDDKGSVSHFVGIQNDVSERIARQKERDQIIRQLKKANHELEDFSHIVSHDLRAPLRGIESLALMINADFGESMDPQASNLFKLMQQRVARMNALIENILEYSSTGRSGEPELQISINDLVKEVIDALAPPAHIQFEIEEALPAIHGQTTQTYQVFQNLIGNAIKYNDKEEGHIKVSCKSQEDYWEIAITDNGPGIDSKYHEKIFGLFESLQSRQDTESTGVGLALVRKIIDMRGGSIWVDSELGKGASFLIRWPKFPPA